MDQRKVQWHPAFCSAMRLELRENREELKFYNEYNLNSKPLEIDLLVVQDALLLRLLEQRIFLRLLGCRFHDLRDPQILLLVIQNSVPP